MPRKSNTIAVTAWPALRKGQRYAAKVKSIKLQKASNRLQVTLENLDQQGRLHEQFLPLPLHLGDRTARFFAACGINIGPVGTTVCVDEALDAVLVMQFQGLGPDGAEDFDFEPVAKPPAADEAVPV